MSLDQIRRVVTGHNKKNKAIISMDGTPPNVVEPDAAPGVVLHEIWKTESSPASINNGKDPTPGPLSLVPPANGSTVRFVDFPPDSQHENLPQEAGATAFREVGADGAITDDQSKHRFMHRTETVDYGVVISGEIVLLLDEEEVRLKVGDVVVQRGTNHAWSNPTDKMTRMLFVLLDGKYAEDIDPS